MIATTPSGTRTLRMSSPFGRRHPSSTSPTGSGSAATWRSPAAMASRRVSVRRSRSSGAGSMPAASAATRSAALASRISGARSSSSDAAACSAASFSAVDAVARRREASLARRPSAATCSNTGLLDASSVDGGRPRPSGAFRPGMPRKREGARPRRHGRCPPAQVSCLLPVIAGRLEPRPRAQCALVPRPSPRRPATSDGKCVRGHMPNARQVGGFLPRPSGYSGW